MVSVTNASRNGGKNETSVFAAEANPVLITPSDRRIRGLFEGNTGRDVAHTQLQEGGWRAQQSSRGNYTAHEAD